MPNLRNDIATKILALTIFLLAIGVFVAVATVDDEIEASWTGSGIEAKAWNLMDNKYYQIRYYQPNTLPDGEISESVLWSDESGADNTGLVGPYDPSTNKDGFYVENDKFSSGSGYTYENPYTETFSDPDPDKGWVPGKWIIILMKGGNDVNSDKLTYANSFRVSCPVDVPIPEFQTIALPIAAILGIMFLLQSRRRKEE